MDVAIHYEDDELRIVKVAGMGPIDNNAYVISCRSTGEAVIIDAPAEPQKLLNELGDVKVKAIFITHRHSDHTVGLEEVKNHTGAPVASHTDAAPGLPFSPDFQLKDGETYDVGKVRLLAKHTPGHSPGAMCLLTGKHLFTGDTLFPGGPGHTGSPEAFRQVKDSIVGKLMPLDDDTAVYPGHGGDTTIGKARQEIKAFDSKSHRADLCGSVEWMNS